MAVVNWIECSIMATAKEQVINRDMFSIIFGHTGVSQKEGSAHRPENICAAA